MTNTLPCAVFPRNRMDRAEAYAKTMRAAGVPVRLVVKEVITAYRTPAA